MLLNDIFTNAPSIEIKQLSCDSRIPMKDAIFFCVQGLKYDGKDFVKEAIDNGAKVIVYDNEIDKKYKAIYVKVKNVDESIKRIGSKFFGYPQKDLETYVVSGCYGRSSVSSFINQYLKNYKNTGYIGRFGIKYNDYLLTTNYPTLTSLDNLSYIKKMKDENIETITFEATSSALAYNKLNIINPDIFVYTSTYKESSEYKENNTDYFKNIRNYLYTLERNTTVVLNKNDISYDEFKDCDVNIVTYGTDDNSDFVIKDVNLYLKGTSFTIINNGFKYDISSKLIGLTNVYNLTATFVSLVCKGYDPTDIALKIKDFEYIPGKNERIDDQYNIFVDCANSITSINDTLRFYKSLNPKNRTIGVIGISSTDEDYRLKSMMESSEQYLDLIILTEEDSHDLDISKMLDNARKYLKTKKVLLVESRELAIESAIDSMNVNDTLLLLGMGDKKIMYKGLGKQVYNGDKNIALKYFNKRREEENEVI